jgi:hypothetical protein
MPIFSHCWPPAEAFPVRLSDTRKEVPNDIQEIPPFWPANAALFRLIGTLETSAFGQGLISFGEYFR